MKKNYIKIITTAALILLFAGCQVNETDLQGNLSEIGKNTVAFSVGGVDTRSSVAISDISEPGLTISLGADEMGNNFILEESVVDLNSPITRGTPAYTENVVTLYDGKLFAHSELGNDTYKYEESSKCYTKSYGKNIWDVADPLNFWMYMPVEITSYGVTAAPTFAGGGTAAQTISFSYESPSTAAAQADIIFAARSIDETTYENNERKMDVLFHHALTGVKFAIGNDAKDKIAITKITFTGLYDKGSCVVTPTTEGGEYQDIADNHSSASNGVVVWTLNETRVNESIYSEFGENDLTTFAQPAEGSTTGSFTSKGKYPASFSQKGNENNLNDGDASKTFWLIPQDMTDDIQLIIEYTVDGATASPLTIDFGEALNGVSWLAGQLRTYTIRVADVNVKIEDEVTMSENYVSTNFLTAVGSKKESVVITNTGNTPAYIRAAIVGQWIDANGKPVFAFTEFKNGKIEIYDVPSWYQDQFGSSSVSPTYIFGYFSELAGYDASSKHEDSVAYSGSHWTKGDDGYYYYDDPVLPGEATAEPLFESYTIASVPNIRIAGVSQEVTFVLEVATQAISANNSDGTQWDSATAAWNNAKQQQ